jgi:hypothetical protein
MENLTDRKQLTLFSAEPGQEHQREDALWRRSIPAQVFLNHFYGICYHLREAGEAHDLHKLPFFLNFRAHLDKGQLARLQKYLVNSWSAEYALRTTALLKDDAYQRNSLYWTFPQAYYSMYSGIQAFLLLQGLGHHHVDLIRREVGRLVVRGAYPDAIGFYAAGRYGDFKVFRLPLAKQQAVLHTIGREGEAQAHIGQFLRTTRSLRARSIRQRIQGDPDTALRSPKTGKVLTKFNEGHWEQLTWRLGYTTFFDLMARLQISSSHKEIERYVEAEIEFGLFHESLLEIVEYLNFVHETYVARALGLELYSKLIDTLPEYLRNSFVKERLQHKIVPVLKAAGLTVEDSRLGLTA